MLVVALVAAWFVSVPEARASACGPGDLPETGVQGEVPAADQLSGRSKQGYRCNVRPVGSNDLDGLGGDIQLTWFRTCAYQVSPKGDAASEGVAVLDVADPRRPRLVTTLREPAWAGRGGPALGIHEGVHASAARGILIVPIGTMLSIYDVSKDCRRPVHVADVDAGTDGDPTHSEAAGAGGIHSGQLSPDGTLYFATDIGNGAVAPNGPCLTIFDLADLRHPKLLTRWGLDFPCHDLELRPDGKRAYVGYYAPTVGHPSAVVGAFTPVGQPAHALSGIKVVDITHVRQGKLAVLGQLEGGRQHTEVYARIGTREYLLGAEEAYCPAGSGRIVDITDERHPVEVGELSLAINTLPNCDKASYNQNGDVLHYTSHYLSVDDPSNASLAFYTWYGSGLRVFDIRDPRHPREVAYYNPPVGEGSTRTQDSATTYPRYLPATGQIWFGSRVNGLNVVELDPRLRPKPGGRWSVGVPGRAVAGLASRSVPASEPGFGFCTLAR